MKYLKVILAVTLMLCLCKMPYGYYTLIRFVSTVIFAWFAYIYFKTKQEGLVVTFVGLAMLFQPFVRLVLGREMWNIVDVLVSILLVVLWAKESGYIRKK